MNTKLLMIASSFFMGLIGMVFIFVPNEILQALEQDTNPSALLLLQVTGALYYGFAMINWMAKGILTGGIYARPLAIGNFTHFLVADLVLLKFSLNGSNIPTNVNVFTIFYTVFTVLFGDVLYRNPLKNK